MNRTNEHGRREKGKFLFTPLPFVQGNNIGDIVGIFSLWQESFIKLFESTIQNFFGDVYAFFLIPISLDHFPLPSSPSLHDADLDSCLWRGVRGRERGKGTYLWRSGDKEQETLNFLSKIKHLYIVMFFNQNLFTKIFSKVAWFYFGTC